MIRISNDIVIALHEAGVITESPERLRRVVIDLEVGSFPRIYLEKFGDNLEPLPDILVAALDVPEEKP